MRILLSLIIIMLIALLYGTYCIYMDTTDILEGEIYININCK